MTKIRGFPTLVSLWPDQCESVREGLRCMQRKGHRTWHHNEMPKNHSAIWPIGFWELFTPEQIEADMKFLLGLEPRDAD